MHTPITVLLGQLHPRVFLVITVRPLFDLPLQITVLKYIFVLKHTTIIIINFSPRYLLGTACTSGHHDYRYVIHGRGRGCASSAILAQGGVY